MKKKTDYTHIPVYKPKPVKKVKESTEKKPNPRIKITEEQVRKIRELAATGKYKRREIAEMMGGMPQSTVTAIIQGYRRPDVI